MFEDEQRRDCVDSIVFGLKKTSEFRARKAKQYPEDPRNAGAAETLKKLANDATEVTDDSRKLLQLFCDSDSRI